MIIWLNGPFGVGKTTVARELVSLIAGGRIADPEQIGFVMKRTFWRGVDYQDVSLWRRLTRRQVARAAGRGPVIVPMTIMRSDVFDELTPGAQVFALTAERATLEERIAESSEAQEWRRSKLEQGLAAFNSGKFGELITTDGRTPSEVAQLIVARLPT